MDETLTLPTPTSSAATRETEPAVMAGILSGNTGPDVPTAIEDGSGRSLGLGTLALLLVGGAAVGYGVSRWLRA